jgi:uncharacterized protein (TIGR02147 family)
MSLSQKYHVHLLSEGLTRKQRSNPRYSLRSYARDLDVHPATLSQVLKGKRPLPFKDARKVAHRLGLSPKQQTLFFESFLQSKTKLDSIQVDPNDERFMLDESYFKVIAEWEHYAVLTLFDTEGFVPSVEMISSRLGVLETRAQVVLDNLHGAGLLNSENGKVIKAHPSVRTTEDIRSQALKRSHLETLEIGMKKLEETDVELRDYSSMNLAIDPQKITEAKTIIREFRQKMASLLRDGQKTEVYQLAIQFYPLTQKQDSRTQQGEMK